MEITTNYRGGPATQWLQVDPPLDDLPEHRGEPVGRPRRLQAVDSIDHPLRVAADLGEDGYTSPGRCFQRCEGEWFTLPGREGENVVIP